MTSRSTITARGIELRERRRDLSSKIEEMANKLREEQRTRNEAEENEYNELVRELQLVDMESRALAQPYESTREERNLNLTEFVRENVENVVTTKFVLQREATMSADAAKGGLIPLEVQDIVKPLREELIYDKVGIDIKTGLHGEFIWPLHGKLEAHIAGESVELETQKIDFNKLSANPERVGLATAATREAIMRTDDKVRSIIYEELPASVAELTNRILFSTTKVANSQKLVGPFVGLKAKAKEIGPVLDFISFNLVKAEILAAGVKGKHMAWVMTQAMKAILEGTPKAPNSQTMICENGLIAGIPVFCTEHIGQDYVGLGDWSYQPLGFFGDMDIIMDPYSGAKKNEVNFVINSHPATVTLREEAFKLVKIKNA